MSNVVLLLLDPAISRSGGEKVRPKMCIRYDAHPL
jgi:hypothetical protein